jgi:Ca2+-binding RTX toxin-like protein
MPSTKSQRPRRPGPARIAAEALETRTLLAATAVLTSGVLVVTGTAVSDDVYVTYQLAGDKINVIGATKAGATPALFDRLAVKSIKVSVGDGNDRVFINGSLTQPATIDGGNGHDNLTGGSGNDTITGAAGDDICNGSDGNDNVNAGEGNNTLGGGKGNDVLTAGAGVDRLSGGDGNDTMDGGKGGDRFQGDLGIDTVTYASRLAAVTVDLTDGATEVADDGEAGEKDFVTTSVEYVIGGAGADKFTGTVWAFSTATPLGFTRDNRFVGNGGNDVLTGLDGNDVLDGGLGTDQLLGGAGTDTADYASRGEALKLTLDGLANDGAIGENDKIASDVENLTAGNGADTITGNALANVLAGNGGNDTIRAGAGNDRLVGGAGLDQLFGEAGDDLLYVRSTPPADADRVDGGDGLDKAQVDALDTRIGIEALLA